MKLTGERPLEGETPAALLALHDAGYREVAARLGDGALLDVGCGTGGYTSGLLAPGRPVVGVDYDPATAVAASRDHLGLVTACADGRTLPFREGAFRWACSSHLIEHFTDPARHAADLARVLTPDGTAFVVTPNAPADFENPYHVHLFGPADLHDLLSRWFHDVEVVGLDGDAVVKADFDRRRRVGRAVLRVDVLDLRHRLPPAAFERLHAVGRRVLYPVLERRSGPTITADRFAVTRHIDDSTLVLFATARRPRRGSG